MTNTTIGNASGFNSAKFEGLVRQAMGTHSIVEFAPICGLSVSFLSKSVNRSLRSRPGRSSLLKLADASQGSGITLEDYYDACGYDSASIADDNTNLTKDNRLSLEEAERAYFASPSVLAVSQFLSLWMKNGNNPDVNFELFEEGKVFIVTDRASDFKAVCIAGFCQDKTGMKVMRSEIMARTFAALGVADRNSLPGDVFFYLLTDSVEMFDFCANDLPKLSSQNIVVLLSNEQHTEFCEQKLRLSEGQEELQLPRLVTETTVEIASASGEEGSDATN